MKHNFKAKYDVIVLGFGGAGATAARFAADHGAKVLLVDSAPYGHEGGNTRYCGQLIGTSDDYDKTIEYYHHLTEPMHLPEDMATTYVHGMAKMRDYIKNYLDVNPVSCKHDKLDVNKISFPLKESLSEFPEYPGSNSMDFSLVHQGIFDGALWRILRQKVLERKDKIDVWLDSPAKHLIQDPDTKTIIGVQIKKDGQVVEVLARKGVVLTTGGYENNPEMVQNFLGSYRLVPLGTLYNKGAGVRMAMEVGAKLWHMWNYEAGGSIQHGLIFETPKGQRARTVFAASQFSNGSIFTVTDDGTRYFKEDEHNRHGHTNHHGTWRIPYARKNTHMIFDQKQYDYINSLPIPYEGWNDSIVKADTVEELAKEIHVPVENLKKTFEEFNKAAKTGIDAEFHRDSKSMRELETPYYAVRMNYTVLNTQGGPERNSKAEIIDLENNPIPHLYGAGELGGICANDYQTACNIAECLIFGKIAGDNIVKEDSLDVSASDELNGINNLVDGDKVANVKLENNQYLGSSDAGIGGKLVVRVTYDDNKIENVEVIQNHESEDVGKKALKIIPKRIIEANSTDVDAVSGASATSRAISEAVKKALKGQK